MTPHRPWSRAGKAVVAAIALAATLSGIPASAQPTPDTPDAVQRYEELGAQAAKTNEDLLRAQENLKAKQSELDAANDDVAAATKAVSKAEDAEARLREQAERFIEASFKGANLNKLSAVLTSDSSRDYLDRAAALNWIATQKTRALEDLQRATAAAEQAKAGAEEARQRAMAAKQESVKILDKIRQRKADLDAQIKQLRRQLSALSPAQRAGLGTVQDTGSYSGPPGAANNALQAALSKRGSEYEWGAEGPNEFDCSGLTSWAYRQAGVSIPRTAAQQYFAGSPISLDAIQPGDLLFYDDGTGNPNRIHHVGMYVGSGKMVDAPTEGQLVDVRPIEGDGHLIGARRMVG